MQTRSTLSPHAFRDLRQDLFQRQKQAALALEVAAATLCRWEKGVQPIPKWAEDRLREWYASGRPREYG